MAAKNKRMRIDPNELEFIVQNSGLRLETVIDKYHQFCHLCENRPQRGLTPSQFLTLYKRAYPNAVNPLKLADSVFRLCDHNEDGFIDFQEYVASLCIPSHRIATAAKFKTLFRILDYQRLGYLTPGSLMTMMRDVFDILGLLSKRDHHRESLELFKKIDTDGDCKIYETEFVRNLICEPIWVQLLESCNFCVPSPDTYLGQSSFWGLGSSSPQPRRLWENPQFLL